MNVRNCRKCGKIFNYVSGPPICIACKEEAEQKYQQVKKYVQDHKVASIPDICNDCEVESTQVQQWIREERLVFAEDSAIGIPCEKCGTTIKTGRFCDTCKANMTNSFNDTMKSMKKPEPAPRKKDDKDNPRMRFL